MSNWIVLYFLVGFPVTSRLLVTRHVRKLPPEEILIGFWVGVMVCVFWPLFAIYAVVRR